jgi:hypothetical protein
MHTDIHIITCVIKTWVLTWCVAQVSLKDIGAIAAMALLNPAKYRGQTIDLVGTLCAHALCTRASTCARASHSQRSMCLPCSYVHTYTHTTADEASGNDLANCVGRVRHERGFKYSIAWFTRLVIWLFTPLVRAFVHVLA